LVGARNVNRLNEALGALDVTLSENDLAQITQAIPSGAAAGERYSSYLMAGLDSEKGK
jgi:aryl-alcohol dehydrogenase-like predicted oxidoreductase